jgi:hypothetical protein
MLKVEPRVEDIEKEHIKVERINSEGGKKFIDAKLYIPVHSFLEESIPNACNKIILAMHGNTSEKESAINEIIKIIEYVPEKSVDNFESSEESQELVEYCMKHVIDLKDYLTEFVKTWCEHTNVQNESLIRLLTKTTRDFNDLERVRDKYLIRDKDFVMNEYLERVRLLSETLEEELNKIFNKKPSMISRDRIQHSSSIAQKMFIEYSKKIQTEEFKKIRDYYESEIQKTEKNACELFKSYTMKWYTSLVKQ